MRRRVEPDEGGDPSLPRAIQRAVASAMLGGAGVMLAIAWAGSEGLFGDELLWLEIALAGGGGLLMVAGLWLRAHALRRFTSEAGD